jgi:hypothetical protein
MTRVVMTRVVMTRVSMNRVVMTRVASLAAGDHVRGRRLPHSLLRARKSHLVTGYKMGARDRGAFIPP